MVLLVFSVLWLATGHLLVGFLGDVSAVSAGAASGLYLLAERRFGRDRLTSTVLALLFVNVFLQTYEVLYHFSFPVYFNYFKWPFLDGDSLRYLAGEGVVLLPILLVRSRLRFTRIGAGLVALFVLIWGVWILFGFPQYFAPGYFYPQFLASADPYRLSLALNFGSKVVLAVVFASLLEFGTISPKE